MGSGRKYSACEVIPIAIGIVKILDAFDELSVCGSLRRRRHSVGDIDIVLKSMTSDFASSLLSSSGWRVESAEGVRTRLTNSEHPIPLDLWCGDVDTFGSRILHATGSGPHNTLMRRWARESHGIMVTWQGAYRISDNMRLDDGTEDSIRNLIGWPLLKPWERELDPCNLPPWLHDMMHSLDAPG